MKIYAKSLVTFFPGHFDIHLQVIQPIVKISLFNFVHFVPPGMRFEIRKSLKRMPSLAYTEMDQTKYCVSSMFTFGCIIWTLLHVFTCI